MARERVRRQPRAQTREELLDAAAGVFAERGFHGASVEAVADAAGYSTGALYSNFAGKEELFLSLYEERIRRRRGELREAAARSGPAAAAAAVDESLRRDRDFFLLYFEFALHAARNPGFARRFQAVRAEGLAELTAGLADTLEHFGLQSGLAPEELARGVRALSYGMALDHLVGDTGAPENLVGRLLHLTFAGMCAEEGAP